MSGRRRITWWQILLAVAVTALTLGWAAHDVDADRLGALLADTPLATVLGFAAATVLIHVVRVLRWGLLVRPLGAGWRDVVSAGCVGIPATMFLPFRLGEFVRPALLARRGVSFGGGMGSIVVERIADGLVNVALFVAVLGAMPASLPIPPEVRTMCRIAGALFGGAFLTLMIAARFQSFANRMLERLLRPVPEPWRGRLGGWGESFLESLRVLQSGPRALLFVALTVLYWAINAGSVLAVMRVFAPVPLLAGPFTVSVLVFAIMIPGAPGFIGSMEAGFRLGLGPFGVAPEVALAVAILVHSTTLVLFGVFLGVGLSLHRTQGTGKTVA